jgi:hypothetical protein
MDACAGVRDTTPVSRRQLFTRVSSIIGAVGLAARASAGPEVSADVDPSSLLVKLIRRVTYGFNDHEMSQASSLGYWGYLERQLNHTAIDDQYCNAILTQFNTINLPSHQMFGFNPFVLVIQCQEAALYRKIYSNRQLFERMVEFWTDHFNIDAQKGLCNFLKAVDDREVIRAHALGNFATLLRATAESPAMLEYLNNNLSTAAAPNENYARELMELHTVGVGNYTQADIREVARCFTGWEYTDISTAVGAGTFRFVAAKHDAGQKVLFAGTPQQVVIHSGGGKSDGDQVLTALINHPSTARHIATKLCRFFLAENPEPGAVSRVAQAYTSSGGDIKTMLRAVLQPAFLAAASPKYKRPLHFAASCLRAIPTDMQTAYNVRLWLDKCGHQFFSRTTPDGYPDTAAFWRGNLLPRWNFGFLATGARIGSVTVDVFWFFGNTARTPEFIADRIEQGIFGGDLTRAEKDLFRDYIIYEGNLDTVQMKDVTGLAFASPSFQWY